MSLMREKIGKPYGMMIKTVSEDCNLSCQYCYYSHVLGRPQGIRVPSDAVLAKLLSDYLTTCGRVASITWQGGEPLLAGIGFFRKVLKLEMEYARPGTVLSNAIQTNGVLMNQEWAVLFREYRFLVGVSLDGPEDIHNRYRVDAGGHGSFTRVMRGLDWLRRERVEFNVLTVIGPHNVTKARELMKFYRNQQFRWVQFIPQMTFSSQDSGTPGQFDITAEEYGNFLCEAFDSWYNAGHPPFSIRYFDNVLQTYMGQVPDICTMQQSCPALLVVESSGDIYACDFYLDDQWRLGNVTAMPLIQAFETEGYRRFQNMKPRLPEKCVQCSWVSHCQGGCPRNRGGVTRDDLNAPDYFCTAYMKFFHHADSRLKTLASRLRQNDVGVSN